MMEKNLDDAILQAAEKIQVELEGEGDLRGDLDALLAEVGEAPEERRRAANRALNLLIRHPKVWERLREQLPAEMLDSEEMAARLFEPLPGGAGEVEAGTVMVCPVDPSHYRKRLQQKGQVLFCPQHGVRLVPPEVEVPAGTLMVCPVEPTRYRKRLQQKGQVLFCPKHGVRLVPQRD
jgi:hypothetical protein